jgi:hypothetical protein
MLFVGYVDGATTIAKNRGGGGVDKSEHSHPLLAIFSGRKTTEKTEHYRSF